MWHTVSIFGLLLPGRGSQKAAGCLLSGEYSLLSNLNFYRYAQAASGQQQPVAQPARDRSRLSNPAVESTVFMKTSGTGTMTENARECEQYGGGLRDVSHSISGAGVLHKVQWHRCQELTGQASLPCFGGKA